MSKKQTNKKKPLGSEPPFPHCRLGAMINNETADRAKEDTGHEVLSAADARQTPSQAVTVFVVFLLQNSPPWWLKAKWR